MGMMHHRLAQKRGTWRFSGGIFIGSFLLDYEAKGWMVGMCDRDFKPTQCMHLFQSLSDIIRTIDSMVLEAGSKTKKTLKTGGYIIIYTIRV